MEYDNIPIQEGTIVFRALNYTREEFYAILEEIAGSFYTPYYPPGNLVEKKLIAKSIAMDPLDKKEEV